MFSKLEELLLVGKILLDNYNVHDNIHFIYSIVK